MNDITLLLDAHSGTPLYEQLYRGIAQEILQGRLTPGTRLPSRRALSRHLKVSGQTADAAFDLLKAEGFVRAEPRRGLFVEKLTPLPRLPLSKPQTLPPVRTSALYDFSPQAADTTLFPYREWAKLVREGLLLHPDLLKKGDPKGEMSLRQALCDFLYQYRGVHCHAEDLVIGSGVDQLLGIIGAMVKSPAKIAVEDPGYREAARALERTGHQALPIPLDAQGLSVEALKKSKASLAYVTPAHQFPTGVYMPVTRRAELLYWAQAQGGRFVIEDDYDSEFRYISRPLPALQSMDGSGKTIYISTFSRTLAPGIRVAFMALPPVLTREYERLGLKSGDAVSRFEQHAVSELIAQGHYTRHLRRAKNAYQQRCGGLVSRLLQIPGSLVSGEEAGLHFVFQMSDHPEETLIRQAAQAGIPLLGLSSYGINVPQSCALVLGFAGLPDNKLDAAVAALRTAWMV